MANPGNETWLEYSLFVSDLHLCHSRPAITEQFIQFLQNSATHSQSLYVLGDLFEYWAGDDDIDDAHNASIARSFKALADTGTAIYFMHGNRDFLLGDDFAATAGIKLLQEPTLLSLYGKRVLLSHGDTLCTDDTAYQAFRQQVRAPAWQREFLDQPLQARKHYIESLRLRSEQEKSYKTASIMDVNAAAVAGLLREYDYPELLIHGHTHRPGHHLLEIDGRRCERWVLGDWYEQGSCLRLDTNGVTPLPIA